MRNLEIENSAIQIGYFQNRIRHYIEQYHPDLLSDPNLPIRIRELTDFTIESIQDLVRAGFQTYEAIEASISGTLDSITSPYASLKNFLIEHQEHIYKIAHVHDADDNELIFKLLPLIKDEINIIDSSTSPAQVSQAERDLLRIILKSLLNRN